MIRNPYFTLFGALASILLLVSDALRNEINVTTYHYDHLRTGWNQQEFVLNTTNVSSSQFGLLREVPLDDRFDA
jgi:hypothetical protein